MSEITLTNSQSLMLTGQKLCPESPLYNMAFRFDIFGAIDLTQFSQAIDDVIQANDVLRLCITQDASPSLGNAQVEHSDSGKIAGESLDSLVSQPLDLSNSCLQTRIYQVSPEHHVWFINKHHLITDGASFIEFFHQVSAAYSGQTPHRNSFARYLAGSRKVQATQRFKLAQDYWEKKSSAITSASPATNLRNITRRITATLSPDEKDAITNMASGKLLPNISTQLNEFSILAAALLALRHRLYGPASSTLGMPMGGGSRQIIGPTLEIGFIDVPATGHQTFIELVKAVQQDALTAMQHALPGVTSSRTNNSFSWLLNYVPGALNRFADQRCTVEWLHSGSGDAGHDLRVQAHDLNATGGLTLHFDAATRAFTDEQQTKLPELFKALLGACLENPEQPLNSIKWPSTVKQTTPPRSRDDKPDGLLESFHRHVNTQPNAIALRSSDGQQEYTYSDLDQRANLLAEKHSDLEHWVLLLRGPAAIVAILAALKSGKPFVPLDIEHPEARINSILQQLKNPPVFVLPEQKGRDIQSSKQFIVDLNTPLPNTGAGPGPSSHQGSADAPTYIIFTSGTTGTPKGVVVGRASLANYINWAAKTYCNTAPVDMPLYSSLAFDLTITSVLLPLVTGGIVTTYGDLPGTTALAILEVMRDGASDIVKLTPSHLRLVLSSRNVDTSRLQSLILGGEDLPRSLALEAADRLGQPAIYNEYGPTEATIGCMIHRFDPTKDQSTSVPIGKPITNSKVDLVDHADQPIPAGFDGQLVLSGIPLAHGYWQGELLAGSLYKSGDRARQLEDGNLLYQGRLNDQVKFRGARIELAEIENELQASGKVESSAVMVVESAPTRRVMHCKKCGIANNVPRIVLNADDICSVCEDYAAKQEPLEPYFRSLEELRSGISARTAAGSDYDCIVLVSGGKDSSYTLCKIVELGLRPVVFTLDNGYLSKHALKNIERITTKLKVPWVCESPPGMNQIFKDSLVRHSNVCNGCFKTIYTLSINYALKHGISSIVTGLSRGQLFETRLLDMVDTETFNAQEIDARVKRARIAYHKIDDAVAEQLDVSATQHSDTFDRVEFFDFYRYCDSSLDEMLKFLREFGGWERPPDTGRSTNCLINDVGIHVHQAERAHHNYAVPYAWDVRMGHKTRSQAVDELNDELDLIKVHEILDDIDYQVVPKSLVNDEQLVAYYQPKQGQQDLQHDLRSTLSERLPDYSIPSVFVEVKQLPLTPQGKIDQRALSIVDQQNRSYDAPASDLENAIATLWSKTLLTELVGRNDNYFELGGDSISAVQLAVLCAAEDLPLEPTHFFSHPTVRELAELVSVLREANPTSKPIDDTNEASADEPDTGLNDMELEALLNNTIGASKNPTNV